MEIAQQLKKYGEVEDDKINIEQEMGLVNTFKRSLTRKRNHIGANNKFIIQSLLMRSQVT